MLHRTSFLQAGRRFFGSLLFAICLAIVAPRPAQAVLSSIQTRPQAPTTCDSVALLIQGVLPDPCYQILQAVIDGPVPLPTMGPIPTYAIEVKITVREPDPNVGCPTVLQPYDRSFRLGRLLVGQYWVHAVEYVVPFDTTAAPKDSSVLNGSFEVAPTLIECPPISGCFILDFQPDLVGTPGALDPLCDAVAAPGGTACVAVRLNNQTPVGGLQTVIDAFLPLRDPPPGGLLPGSILHPISVETTDRTHDFQVDYAVEESRVRIILFSLTGASISPGSGPVLRVCYAVGAEAPETVYFLRYRETIVADPNGNALPACPTFAEILGRICVGQSGCDLDGNGHSDILDIIRLVHCALEQGSEACPDTVAAKADCNGDGAIDIRDVICCVRKILESGALGSGGGEPPDTTGITRIGFMDDAHWMTPVDGRVSIEIRPGDTFGGIQFAISGGQTPARIVGLSLREPSAGYHLEWKADPDGSVARAMLFADGSATRRTLVVDVALEPRSGPGGMLEILGTRAGTQLAQLAPVWLTKSVADVQPAGLAEAPLVFPARPNPFTGETEIAYTLPDARRVTIRVYGPTGRLVRTLVDGIVPAGVHRAHWDGRDSAGREVGSGVYFTRFSAGDVEKTSRLLKIR